VPTPEVTPTPTPVPEVTPTPSVLPATPTPPTAHVTPPPTDTATGGTTGGSSLPIVLLAIFGIAAGTLALLPRRRTNR
jgi:hypothetical protein